MEERKKKNNAEGGDKGILYSKTIKAGNRTYYLDVRKNLKDDLFLTITESKKVQAKDGPNVTFEKHKIFIYHEDFDKFGEGLADVMAHVKRHEGKAATDAEENAPQGQDASPA